ncbi:ATP-binding protein, partial [Pedobacter sp.]|uniref:ATP-binding protein n=1 Tax=Pedobacter sp. TaxID=1411316 RepID=UPI003D7F204A
LQIANFSHSKGGITKHLIIGDKKQIDFDKNFSDAIDWFLAGCLIMGGLFFLGLYLIGNRDKAILFFAVFSIVYSYRIVGSDDYVLHNMLPDLSWYLTLRLEYISLFLGPALFGIYTRYLYPDDYNRKILYITCAICFAISLLTMVLSPYYFSQLLDPFTCFISCFMLHLLYVYMVACRKKRSGAIYSLISYFLLLAICSHTILFFYGYISSYDFLCFICYMGFFFLQSLILLHRVYHRVQLARTAAEQGLKAKSDFLSTMSHEIRTPLNAVIGMSNLLLSGEPRNDQKENLEVMHFSANNLLAIVNDVLDYSKIEAGKISFEHIEMDIASIARNIIGGLQSAAAEKNISFKLIIDPQLTQKVMGDPTRISQVMTNLVNNAVKFTQKGEVSLHIKVQYEDDDSVSLQIKVIDTGIGISQDKQKLIFERFTQADSSTSRAFGGTGLGLSICKRLLELQNSSLLLCSEEGKGSMFYFNLRFDKGAPINSPQQMPVAAVSEVKSLHNIHILLVEDNLMNVLVAKKYLEQWGANIDVAHNGLEAIEMLDTKKHKMVLMDLHMPVMDGYEATAKMRSSGVTLPIVALTANVLEEIEGQLKQVGMNDCVVKPFLPDELYRKVRHHVN